MRYFTKEWYYGTLIADMCFQLRKTERAAVYSDAFFKYLYAVEERAYLKFCKRNAKALKENFDKDAAIAEFAANYKENLDFVKANLPEDILSDVKDIRILALGSATHEMAMRITRFCGKKNRLCESIEREYNNASEEADEAVGAYTANALAHLNGSIIDGITSNDDGSVVMTLSNAESSRNAQIILNDVLLTEGSLEIKDMTVIKHELLLSADRKFEFSLLLLSPDSSIVTLSCNTSGIKSV